MTLNSFTKAALYFIIAAGTTIAATEMEPTSIWGWFKFSSAVLVSGCIAVRALFSETPPSALEPGTTREQTTRETNSTPPDTHTKITQETEKKDR